VLAKLGQEQYIDVRSPEEFRGERLAPEHLPQEQAQVPGHIPGAVNIAWSKAANDDGTFGPADELRALYGSEGIDPGQGVITYWRTGERSAHTWFVLHELLGYPSVENYDGSWTESARSSGCRSNAEAATGQQQALSASTPGGAPPTSAGFSVVGGDDLARRWRGALRAEIRRTSTAAAARSWRGPWSKDARPECDAWLAWRRPTPAPVLGDP
jgi:rhodanese-related sulfurtransferase